MNTDFPANRKGSTLDMYDNTIDLDESIDVYVTQISLYTSDDAISYRVLSTSFKGLVLSWFT